ncbi:MAG: Na/Pi symporter [Oscillospiraceae bacterium]|nr:Na/Pi symporter [Oscillospiraceae bacterium]
MQFFIDLLGGFAFLLLGMERLSMGLGGYVTFRPGTVSASGGFLSGLAWTAAVQSSSAVTAALVSMASAGLLTAADCFPILLGSNLGTTGTVWLLSTLERIRLQWVGLIPAFFALLLCKVKKPLSEALLGFSLVLLGLELLQDAAVPLRSVSLLLRGPLEGFLSGLLLTAVIQSSAVTIGALQSVGGVSMRVAAAVIVGANIGTCATGLLAATLQGREGKQVAVLQLLINVAGAVLLLPLYPLIPEIPATPVRIAAAHSLFNALTVSLLLPLTGQLQKRLPRMGCVRAETPRLPLK